MPNKFKMIFLTTKQRIIEFIEFKGINITFFLKKTNIKRGFLDKDKLTSAVSDTSIAKIIASFPEINLEWLITGRGCMLKSNFSENFSSQKENNFLKIKHLPCFFVKTKNINEYPEPIAVSTNLLNINSEDYFYTVVNSSAMEPTFSNGERLLLRRMDRTEWSNLIINNIYIIINRKQQICVFCLRENDDKTNLVTIFSEIDTISTHDLNNEDYLSEIDQILHIESSFTKKTATLGLSYEDRFIQFQSKIDKDLRDIKELISQKSINI